MTQITRSSLRISFAAITLSLASILPAQATSLSYSGDTTGGPTFNRPAAPGFEGVDNPSTSLSNVGTAVPYYSQPFFVDTTGSYDVQGTQNFDGIQYLYQTTFSPTASLTNLVNGNDSFPDVGTSGFIGLPLAANSQYYLVTTGYADPGSADISFGSFTNTISGPGNITTAAVPEPSTGSGTMTIALLGGGFLLKRRFQQRKSNQLS